MQSNNKWMLASLLFFTTFTAAGQIRKETTTASVVGAVSSFEVLKQAPIIRQVRRPNPNSQPKMYNAQKNKQAIQNELQKSSDPANNQYQNGHATPSPDQTQAITISPQFDGTGFPTGIGLTPADVTLAAGFEHVMQMTNNFVTIYDKNGTEISRVTLNQFHAPLQDSTFFDPKIMYDHFSNRWIAITPFQSFSINSSIAVVVSQTSDPTGGWYFYRIKADGNSNEWFDYPSVGFTTDKIVFSGNMLFNTGNNTGSRTYALDKSLVYSGTIQPTVTAFNIDFTDATRNVHPSVNYDATGDSYCIEQSVGSGNYSLYKLTGSGQNPSWNYQGELNFQFMQFENAAADAPQKDTTALLDMDGSKILSNVLRNGKLYFTNPVSQASPSLTGVDVAYIDAETRTNGSKKRWETWPDFYGYSNVTVNRFNEIIGAVGSFASTRFPSAAYIYWNTNANTDFINIFKLGEGFVANRDNRGRNRWGDYFGTWLDPADEESVWISASYGAFRTVGTGLYKTSIARVCVGCENTRVVNTPVTSGMMKKFIGTTVEASAGISSGATVKLQGANAVILQPGFLAEQGSHTKIYTAPCTAEIPISQ